MVGAAKKKMCRKLKAQLAIWYAKQLSIHRLTERW
jgi:hypothetical protein